MLWFKLKPSFLRANFLTRLFPSCSIKSLLTLIDYSIRSSFQLIHHIYNIHHYQYFYPSQYPSPYGYLSITSTLLTFVIPVIYSGLLDKMFMTLIPMPSIIYVLLEKINRIILLVRSLKLQMTRRFTFEAKQSHFLLLVQSTPSRGHDELHNY